MTSWVLLGCLMISVWGLSDSIGYDLGAARLWIVVIAVTVILLCVAHANGGTLIA